MSLRIALVLSVLTFAPVAFAQTIPAPDDCLKKLGVQEGQMPTIEQLQQCAPQSPAGTLSTPTAPASISTTIAPSSSCPNLTRTLGKGSRGTDVTQLQSFLIQKGYLVSDSATGYFGALTEAAVQKFQCAANVVCSGNPSSTGYGLVGAKTRAAILRSCGGTTTSTSNTPSNTANSSLSLIEQLSAQIKQLQERIAKLSSSQNTTNASCAFNNQTVDHGASVTAYQSSSVASGQACQSQTRTCSNGTLSGTYTAATCSVAVEGSNLVYGSQCSADSQCTSNICFGLGTAASPVCGNALGTGSTCYRNSECGSNSCVSNKCVATSNLSYGSKCTADNQCASSICYGAGSRSDSVCGNPLGAGSTCYRNSECGSNSCVSNKCVEPTCKAPRHYQYTLSSDVPLPCSGYASLFNVEIPDEGRALATVSMSYRNDGGMVGYWATGVQPGSILIDYADGDDMCPNQSSGTKVTPGFGELTASNKKVHVYSQMGMGSCSNGTIKAVAGGVLDVWVEDPNPSCRGKDIGMKSYYQEAGSSTYTWSSSFAEALRINVPSTDNRSNIYIVASAQGTPPQDPNRYCGSETATLSSQLYSSYHGVVDQKTQVIPPSLGMGHLTLWNTTAVSYTPTLGYVSMLLRNDSSASVFSGIGYGDIKIGFIKY